jgi:transcriptional regulator NrdR family protein
MNCEKCDSVSNLMGSESLRHTIRRMRTCPRCGHKFFTYEIPESQIETAGEFVKLKATR